MKIALGLTLSVGVASSFGALACSSVPDIHFGALGAEDASVDVRSDAATASDGGASSGGGNDAAPPPPPCDAAKPPAGAICCGTKICKNCTEADCASCTCAGTTSDVCCRRPNGMLQCKDITACN